MIHYLTTCQYHTPELLFGSNKGTCLKGGGADYVKRERYVFGISNIKGKAY